MLTVEGCFETVLNNELREEALGDRYFWKYISYDHLLF